MILTNSHHIPYSCTSTHWFSWLKHFCVPQTPVRLWRFWSEEQLVDMPGRCSSSINHEELVPIRGWGENLKHHIQRVRKSSVGHHCPHIFNLNPGRCSSQRADLNPTMRWASNTMSSRGPFQRRWIKSLWSKLMSASQTWMISSVRRWVAAGSLLFMISHKFYRSKEISGCNPVICFYVVTVQTQVGCLGWEDDSADTSSLMSDYVSCWRETKFTWVSFSEKGENGLVGVTRISFFSHPVLL